MRCLTTALLGCLWLLAPAPGCGQVPSEDPTGICADSPASLRCDENELVTCNAEGREVSREACGERGCVDLVGCAVCTSDERYCDGPEVMVCGPDRTDWTVGETCDPGEGQFCDPVLVRCAYPCDQTSGTANAGCELVAVDMANTDEFEANNACFAVVVSNTHDLATAIVTVEDEWGQILDFPGFGTERRIPPGELAVLGINGTPGGWVCDTPLYNTTTMASGLQPGSAYLIKSTLPVVAYQINPYGAAMTHTVDSSLLIPRSVLGRQYLVATYEGLDFFNGTYPASISVVAVEDDTVVRVTPSVGLSPDGVVPATGPFTATLQRLQHLQILSADVGDLTSTVVTSDRPVAVFSGTLCSDVPVDVWSCDHLEEQLPPVQAWGTRYVAALPPRRGTEGTYWRILAAVDDTEVQLEPFSQHNTVLGAGEWIEIDVDDSFVVTSTSATGDATEDPPILVVNYLKGSMQTLNESPPQSVPDALRGDPTMTLSVPVEQYLSSYVFLSDISYAYSYVVVVRSDGSEPVHLDCLDPIPEARFEPIAQGFERALVVLETADGTADGSCQSGPHRIWSQSPFGIWVFGYYQDTSYGHPGGMNVARINEIIVE